MDINKRSYNARKRTAESILNRISSAAIQSVSIVNGGDYRSEYTVCIRYTRDILPTYVINGEISITLYYDRCVMIDGKLYPAIHIQLLDGVGADYLNIPKQLFSTDWGNYPAANPHKRWVKTYDRDRVTNVLFKNKKFVQFIKKALQHATYQRDAVKSLLMVDERDANYEYGVNIRLLEVEKWNTTICGVKMLYILVSELYRHMVKLS